MPNINLGSDLPFKLRTHSMSTAQSKESLHNGLPTQPPFLKPKEHKIVIDGFNSQVANSPLEIFDLILAAKNS